MKDGWKIVPFSEVCEISGGSQPPKDNFIYEPREGYVRLVQVRDYRTDKYITYIPIDKAKKFCKADDIMIGRYGPPIFGIFSGIEGAYNVALMKAIPNESKINKEYLRWFLKTPDIVKFVEKSSKRAAGQDGVRKERLYEYNTPIPPLPEQKQIVETLEKAFEKIDKAIANIKRNIENAEELYNSKLKDLFLKKENSWIEVTLLELLNKNWILSHLDGNHGGDYPRKNEFVESGVPYISANCIRNGYVNFKKAKYLSPERASKLRKGIAKDGDVLFAHNATVGPTAILRTNEGKVILGTSLTYYRCNLEYINPEYLLLYMRSMEFRSQYESVMKQSTRNQVPITKQRTFKHIIPPIKEQNKIIPKLNALNENLERAVDLFKSQIFNLEELKKSILEKAFKGELTSAA